jgi:hypothetical protein
MKLKYSKAMKDNARAYHKKLIHEGINANDELTPDEKLAHHVILEVYDLFQSKIPPYQGKLRSKRVWGHYSTPSIL